MHKRSDRIGLRSLLTGKRLLGASGRLADPYAQNVTATRPADRHHRTETCPPSRVHPSVARPMVRRRQILEKGGFALRTNLRWAPRSYLSLGSPSQAPKGCRGRLNDWRPLPIHRPRTVFVDRKDVGAFALVHPTGKRVIAAPLLRNAEHQPTVQPWGGMKTRKGLRLTRRSLPTSGDNRGGTRNLCARNHSDGPRSDSRIRNRIVGRWALCGHNPSRRRPRQRSGRLRREKVGRAALPMRYPQRGCRGQLVQLAQI